MANRMPKDIMPHHPGDKGVFVRAETKPSIAERCATSMSVVSPEVRAAMEQEQAAVNRGFRQFPRHGAEQT
jgi:orotidine-5'-phosphate decarboxylase